METEVKALADTANACMEKCRRTCSLYSPITVHLVMYNTCGIYGCIESTLNNGGSCGSGEIIVIVVIAGSKEEECSGDSGDDV